MSKRYTGYEALPAITSTKCREVLSMPFTPCWPYIPRRIGVQLSHHFAGIKHHGIGASLSKPYLCTQPPGKSYADGGPNSSFPCPSLPPAWFASEKVMKKNFRPECNAVFLRCSITAFAEDMIYMPNHSSPSCTANSLVLEDIASNHPVCPR